MEPTAGDIWCHRSWKDKAKVTKIYRGKVTYIINGSKLSMGKNMFVQLFEPSKSSMVLDLIKECK